MKVPEVGGLHQGFAGEFGLKLMQIVLAAHAVGGFAHLLHGGKQQPYQDRDDGDHH